ncbi:MAG: GNAT family N-acetyltransferase [Clostridia bacterium]|nr:GNAT family N-acetyltransferase [Clostridia bacterium]
MGHIIRKCDENDFYALQELSIFSFKETFEAYNTEDNMKSYIEEAFNTEKLMNELNNPYSHFYFLYFNNSLAGYLKLNEAKAQTDIHDQSSIEIERIYLKKEFQGKGLGSVLLNRAIAESLTMQKDYIWLGVWEHNHRALSLYEKNGFIVSGKHYFIMGDDKQLDYIMTKNLSESTISR